MAAGVVIALASALAGPVAPRVLGAGEPPGAPAPVAASAAAPGAAAGASPVEAGGSELDPWERQLAEVYRRVSPGVVSVEAGRGVASGFVVDAEGHIVTNYHVVGGATRVEVVFAGGARAEGRVIGTDPDSDLALLRVDGVPSGVQPLELGDSLKLVVGQRAIAVGNPFRLSGTMTVGIISGLHRLIPSMARPFNIPDAIQTDAVINPGNSGGPLVDSRGRVIGVATAIIAEEGRFSGIGFAVPVHLLKRVLPYLRRGQAFPWPWLGISGRTLTSRMAAANGLPVQQGAYVQEVIPNGPAARAGLQGSRETTELDGEPVPVGGDLIVAIDGQPVVTFDDILAYLARYGSVGQTVRLKVMRGQQTLEIPVTLEPRPGATLGGAAGPPAEGGDRP